MSNGFAVFAGRFRSQCVRVGAAALVVLAGVMWDAPAGPPATAAAVAAGPKAYIGLYGDDAVGVLDTSTGRLLRTIKVPAGPEAVIVAPGGRRVYVSSEDATAVSVVDTTTDTVIKTLDVGKFPEGMALSRDGRTLLVAVFGIDKVDLIDTATFTVEAQFAVAKAHGVTLAPDGRTAYVGAQDVPNGNAIVVLDVANRRIAARVPLDNTPRGLFLAPDGKSLYFTVANSAAVYILDRATRAITGRITVGPIPHQMAFTPDHRTALVVVQGSGRLAVVDLASRRVRTDIAVGRFPHWVAITSDGALAYVANEGDNTLSVVNVASEKVVATLPVGGLPRKISLQPGPGAMSQYTPFSAAEGAAGFAGRPLRPAPAAKAGDAQIHIRAFSFGAQTVTVAAGHAVTWINDDPVPHTATAQTTEGKLWDTGQVVPGGTMRVTLTTPGTFVYQCDDHPFMRAKLIVTR